MKKLFLSITLVCIGAISTFAQKNMLGINIKVYDPVSDFDKNVSSSVPAGISLNYMRTPVESRWSFGGELGVAMYSSNDYTLQHNGNNIEVNEEDCFWTVHGVVRYDVYRTERFVTYAEGRMGMTTFFSSTTALEDNSDFDDEFSFHGSAFNTGLGGGVLYQLGGSVWLNAGVNVHSGSRADYRYMPESDQSTSFDDGHYKSLTHYVGYRLGVSIGL